jgi:hypothetical protein
LNDYQKERQFIKLNKTVSNSYDVKSMGN